MTRMGKEAPRSPHAPVHRSTSASFHMVSFSLWSGWLG